MHTRTKLVALAAAVTLSLSACSEGDSEPSTAIAGTNFDAASPPEAAELMTTTSDVDTQTLQGQQDKVEITSDKPVQLTLDAVTAGSILIDAPSVTITLDGKSTASSIDATGTLVVAGDGSLEVTSDGDAIEGEDVVITGGTITATAGDKAINAERFIIIDGGTVNVTAADDGLHSNGSIRLSNGDITVSAQDDGVHADIAAILDGADLTVTESEEALEAGLITIAAGDINLTSNDDGINASGATSAEEAAEQAAAEATETADPGQPQPGGPEASTGEQLDISGGTITINAGGDGIDSNGDATITGGTVTVFGPTNDGNGALDVAGTFAVHGGKLLAVGSAGMAETPDEGQPWIQANVNVSAGETITITDADGNEIASFTTLKDTQNVVYSSPQLQEGATYAINDVEVTTNEAAQRGGPGGPMGGGPMGGGPGGGPMGGGPGGMPGNPGNPGAIS
ncbi:carbohydrate-binding domain-containing protein [Corynebacterium sp. CCUG 18816]|uniref:carbohydrate-binding domain-containing protein n=1 Tax=Corynebacterium pseudogenitalium TaxID=38303 RepID=UPI0021094186|nr:carbohydrate-binding domain-containing protein [Corynebacterium pseudogenitalium]MCQ4617316.1 carbohydrate-binding domain-containing protein [Corynebacterium pseudogenitalium]